MTKRDGWRVLVPQANGQQRQHGWKRYSEGQMKSNRKQSQHDRDEYRTYITGVAARIAVIDANDYGFRNAAIVADSEYTDVSR